MRRMLLALLCASISVAQAREVDLSAPQTKLGVATSEGIVRLFTDLTDFNLGNVPLPVRFDFSSARQTSSPYGGWGFSCGLMESKAVLVKEKVMKVDLLCSKTMYLKRSNADPSKFKTLDGEWSGDAKGDQFVVSRDDGWRLVYKGGRIQEIRTDEGRALTWVYSGDTPVQLREGGTVILDTEIDPQTNLVKRIIVAGKTFDLVYGNRPDVKELQGARLVAGLRSALATVKVGSGTTATFEFDVREKDLTPKVAFSDTDDRPKTVGWNPSTGQIAFEDEWTYDVSKTGEKAERPQMTRVSDNGKKEFYHFDHKTGTIKYVDADGLTTVTKVYRVSGPLYDKVRSVQKGRGQELTTVFNASYDEAGRLIRRTTETGIPAIFRWTKTGKLQSIHRGENLVLSRQYDQDGRLLNEDIPGVRRTEHAYKPDGEVATTVTKNGKTTTTVRKPAAQRPVKANSATPRESETVDVAEIITRESEVARLTKDLVKAKTPRERAERMIYIGQRFSNDPRWPLDAEKAIETYEAIAREFSSDPLIVTKAKALIATVRVLQKAPQSEIIAATKAALAVDATGVSAADEKAFTIERGACFRNLLMLSRTKDLDKDLELFEKLRAEFQKTDQDARMYQDAVSSAKEAEVQKLLGMIKG